VVVRAPCENRRGRATRDGAERRYWEIKGAEREIRPRAEAGRRPVGLAAEDLGDALLADLQDPGDRLLGQAGAVGETDLLVALGL
jgi:hypothetical protein